MDDQQHNTASDDEAQGSSEITTGTTSVSGGAETLGVGAGAADVAEGLIGGAKVAVAAVPGVASGLDHRLELSVLVTGFVVLACGWVALRRLPLFVRGSLAVGLAGGAAGTLDTILQRSRTKGDQASS